MSAGAANPLAVVLGFAKRALRVALQVQLEDQMICFEDSPASGLRAGKAGSGRYGNFTLVRDARHGRTHCAPGSRWDTGRWEPGAEAAPCRTALDP